MDINTFKSGMPAVGGAPALTTANLDQVYPVLSLYEENGETLAKVGAPLKTERAFGPPDY